MYSKADLPQKGRHPNRVTQCNAHQGRCKLLGPETVMNTKNDMQQQTSPCMVCRPGMPQALRVEHTAMHVAAATPARQTQLHAQAFRRGSQQYNTALSIYIYINCSNNPLSCQRAPRQQLPCSLTRATPRCPKLDISCTGVGEGGWLEGWLGCLLCLGGSERPCSTCIASPCICITFPQSLIHPHKRHRQPHTFQQAPGARHLPHLCAKRQLPSRHHASFKSV